MRLGSAQLAPTPALSLCPPFGCGANALKPTDWACKLVAVGDAENDIELVQEAGVAVTNTMPTLNAAACRCNLCLI